MISRIIKAGGGVIRRSRRLTQITPTEALIIRFIRTSYKFNYFDRMLELLYFISKNASVVAGDITLFVDVTS